MSESVQIELKNIEKHYGNFHALKDVSLEIKKGQFVALVGPSGCGKSTLLRSIAGLEKITSGSISIAGNVIDKMPPRKRDLAMVFQSYALYPHMNVRDNLTYSLRLKGIRGAEAAKRAMEVAQTIGLDALLDRFPRELSGGQRQRVAMGRAIIRNPKAFLFDEPLSNLDAALRVHMRKEIRALHDRLAATSVYVTHDQIEAMTMADHVVVLRDGKVEQQGSPIDLYTRPTNRFVAGFIGSPAMNFVDAEVIGDGQEALLHFDEEQKIALPKALEAGRKITIGLRPEHLSFGSGEVDLHTQIAVAESTGSATFYSSASTPELMLVEQGQGTAKAGDSVVLNIAKHNVHMFDSQSQMAL